MCDDLLTPLSRQEVINTIERRKPRARRVPMMFATWWGEGLREQYGDRLKHFEKYPEDRLQAWMQPLDIGRMSLPWRDPASKEYAGVDSNFIIPNYEVIDAFIEQIPNPDANQPGLFDHLKPIAQEARDKDIYLLFGWWGLFFETCWNLRGMANLMMDYHLNGEGLHKLQNALCDRYCSLIRRAHEELHPDGFFCSDDLGHQTQLMMSPKHFREFIYPYYKRVGDLCRKTNMHFWLHSCGNNTEALPLLIDVGLNVFHPVQKHTMDEKAVARKFGDELTFLVGFDVQHTLREGTTDEVRSEVRHLIDTFDRPDGGMIMAAGNGIVGGTPFDNIDAYLDETVRYGAGHRADAGHRAAHAD